MKHPADMQMARDLVPAIMVMLTGENVGGTRLERRNVAGTANGQRTNSGADRSGS